MKSLLTIGTLFLSLNTLAATVDLQKNTLNPEIANFLANKLTKCTLDIGNEVFYVEKIQTRNIKIDQGITDVEYTIDITYDAVRNDVLTNDIRVVVLDSDFDNYKNYEERLSLEIIYDRNNFCN